MPSDSKGETFARLNKAYNTKSKRVIRSVYDDDIRPYIDAHGHLDHVTSAVEAWVESRLLKRDGDPVTFKIRKRASDRRDKGGVVFVYPGKKNVCGANIVYSSKGTALQSRAIVGHELGHLLFNVDWGKWGTDVTSFSSDKPGFNDESQVRETAASFFAKHVLTQRAKQYGSSDFIAERQYTDGAILSAISGVQKPPYDEAVLDE